tara:strand:+ start:153979 stop:154566 length:588 start_codon:yes stop_codon:yes gene_type:complete
MTNHVIVLHGKRIDLALMQGTYLPDIVRIMNDVRVSQYLRAVPPLSFKIEEEWLESLEKSKTNIVFAVLKKNGDGSHTYIGHIGLHLKEDGVALTGAVLDPEFCDNGYGTEAKMLQLYYAFYFRNLRKIRSSVISTNPRSARYLEKTGHKKVAVFKGEHVRKGVVCDEIHYELFPEDFASMWEKYKKEHGLKDPF